MTPSHLAISVLLCAAKQIALEERPRDLGRAWENLPHSLVAHIIGIPLLYALCRHSEVAKQEYTASSS